MPQKIIFYTKGVGCLCFNHALGRALKGEYIDTKATNQKGLECSDCFTENNLKTKLLNTSIKETFESLKVEAKKFVLKPWFCGKCSKPIKSACRTKIGKVIDACNQCYAESQHHRREEIKKNQQVDDLKMMQQVKERYKQGEKGINKESKDSGGV